jgi:transposase
MSKSEIIQQIRTKYVAFSPYLNERTRRIWAAVETQGLSRGGISQVSTATGLSRSTIYAGLAELSQHEAVPSSSKIRRDGGGRKRLQEADESLIVDLKLLLEDSNRGDPESVLQWTCLSISNLATAMHTKGHKISERTICSLLHELGYSLQSNRKTKEGNQVIDRDKQFRYIKKTVNRFQNAHEPVISVDAKKKELIGNYKNSGQTWRPQGQPIEVNMHDFPDEELGKALPYGVYDIGMNQGWVSVGISHDTAELAVETIRRWWQEMGQPLYPLATKLLITADCGGSNSNRSRLWKAQLQKLADELQMVIEVCHFPPGTSKWNKIEHQLFCHITKNWRGKPLVSRGVVVKLIGNTTTKQGLKVKAKLDKHQYKTKIKVSDEDFQSLLLEEKKFHGEWNYSIRPRERV